MSYFDIPLGDDFPNIVNCVVEIPKDTNVKYEYDPNLDIFKVDRCLITAMRYPVNYGFVPQTKADDGDPLDVIIYSRFSFATGCVSECKIIGGLDMTENGKKDYKIIGVPMFIESVNHIKDLKGDWLEVTRDFFKNYKNVEKKKVTVGKWFTSSKAKTITKQSVIKNG